MDSAPSMVSRAGDTLIVRRVVSGEQLVLDQDGSVLENYIKNNTHLNNLNNLNNLSSLSNLHHRGDQLSLPAAAALAALTFPALQQQQNQFLRNQQLTVKNLSKSSDSAINYANSNGTKSEDGDSLPQCKIKRNYSCNNCSFFTQNPRKFLTHLRDLHGEKIVINECKFCLYASRHYQKLVRHMKMVHGSTEGINEPSHFRRRLTQNAKEAKKRKMSTESKTAPNLNQMPDNPINLSHQMMLQFGQQMQQMQQMQLQQQLQQQQMERDVSPDDFRSMDLSGYGGANKVRKCILCEFTTVGEEQLIQHEKLEHNKTKFFRCEKCSYVTHIKARFSKHVKYHSMPMIKCSMCDFRTPYKWNLDRHMKNHGGNGAYKCSVCNFTADIKQSLTVHEMNHHVPPLANSLRDGEMSGDEMQLYNMFNPGMEEGYYRDGSVEGDSDRSSPKRKKPVPGLIPLPGTALNLSKSSNESDQKNDSSADEEEEDARERPDMQNMQQSYKIISSLLSRPELSVDCINKNLPSTSSAETLALKKKNTTFFDKLKEKLITNSGDTENLMCKCLYEAKSLSDLIIHQKICSKAQEKFLSPGNGSNAMNSTRCQFCRHRCKSNADLQQHLQQCAHSRSPIECLDSSSDANGDDKSGTPDYMSDDEAMIDNPNEPHPMENRVFVWNNVQKGDQSDSNEKNNDDSDDNNLVINQDNDNGDDDDLPDVPLMKNSEYLGVESAPGYGEITKKIATGEEFLNTAMKKVFKCPHCSFWASTASRFHVHIVGHLNKKPFECSLCAYRSNWRWDITKHIRLKLLRDPSHGDAKVLMNDETGRRNYSKYNKYITLMRVVDKKHDGKLTKSGCVSAIYSSPQRAENSQQGQSLPITTPPSAASTPLSIYSDHQLSSNAVPSKHFSESITNFLKNLGNPSFNLQNLVAQAFNASQGNSSENLIQQDVAKEAAKEQEQPKKTHFKCKKCNFKHPEREVVLEHVKSHYRDANAQEASQAPSELSAPPNPVVQMPFAINAAINNLLSVNDAPSQASTALNLSNSNSRLHPIAFDQHNGMDGVTPTKGCFKCGHCGQISNWKHVIQRHCRLKHSGDILIEISGAKIEKARHPFEDLMKPKIPKLTARPLEDLQQPNRATKPSFLIYPSISNQRPMVPASDLFEEQHSANSCLASMLKVEMKPDDCDEPMDVQEIPEPVTNQIVLENHSPVGKITKRYQCELCPYETDSKSQFLYHKSFHRPKNSSYQCKYCSYNVSRRHLLSQHMKMHRQGEAGASEQEDGNDVQLIPIESSHGLEKLMHFCGLCPARYLSLKEISTHLQLHESDGEYRCDFCTFSSSDESFVKSHATVHSTYYQEKTKEFLAKYKMATHFESPELFAVKQNEFGLSEDIWIVKGAEAPRSQSDDHVTTSADKCPYCPLQAPPGVLKDHMQGHLAISGMDRMAKCAHCDYSADEVNSLKDHIKLHFMTLLGGPGKTNVDMFSNFRNLELSITKIPNSSTSNDTNNNNVGGETTSIFKENEMHMADDELPKDRIIIDV